MTIIYLNLRFLTQRITGVQRFAFEICKALDLLLSAEANLKVIGLMPRREIQSQYANLQFQNIRLQRCGRFSGHLWEQLELPYYSYGHKLLNLCNSAPLFKLQQWLTLHDVIFLTKLDSQKSWFKLWYRLIATVTKYTALKIFTVSEFSKGEIMQRLGVAATQVVVLGNAANMCQYPYDPSILRHLGLARQEYFFMLGSNSLRKNTRRVGELFAEDSRFATLKLVIAGGEFSNLGAVTSMPERENIIKAGYVSDAQLRSLYANAQALIFPSTYEGFGIPLLEAMAEQTPVICADIAVTHEVCQDGALYFDPTSGAALAQQILNLVDDPELRQDLVARANIQLERFKWHDFATTLLATLQPASCWTG